MSLAIARSCFVAGAAAFALLGAGSPAAFAADQPAPQGVVNLQASATAEVPRDLLSVTLSVTREGADAAVVQSGLKQALDAALAEAKKAAKPGLVDVQTGNFSLFPRYGKQNTISAWNGTAELVIEGRDMPAIAALTGRITTMTVARVNYALSRELREKTESELIAKAIARYRASAADMARHFGYAGYTLREVSVSSTEPSLPQPMPRARMAAAAAPMDEALPVEAGKGVVSVVVSGSVQLTR
jgi:predicted secreted protein